ncbi:hypothetical protein ASE71_03560 [Ensifer sp. Root954]|nr:hypothetical protein ASD49_30890 [Ensifer sp. Root1298]KQX85530.1 hypothetical protein ASD41_30260 [Ensifer sp. Root1312]KRD76191.1 hypothetical protein ASE71_03560 [Ensifer sp. Root954]
MDCLRRCEIRLYAATFVFPAVDIFTRERWREHFDLAHQNGDERCFGASAALKSRDQQSSCGSSFRAVPRTPDIEYPDGVEHPFEHIEGNGDMGGYVGRHLVLLWLEAYPQTELEACLRVCLPSL